VLGRVPGYVGVATWMGSQFTTVEDAMMPVLEGLKERGLMLVDSRGSSRSIATELASSIQLPRAFNNRFLDATPSISAVDRALADLETVSADQRVAIGIARPLPVTIDRISRWAGTLEAKGLVLAPVSSIADRQRLR
ncbi:MAG: divergent polysaccharide deacetylase family protein, partial [bacterium]|nr:divergent polysaccharide deacetylase family protein [bacterium]